ncbi:Protein_tyrosine phosphatase [Hexamita inflata]|uniref:Protein tyrosine phosphatase n=1 Tax=Hexamita inflata TaxID=28002 RepID=A0AA86PM12_9EUKA|nr:Protein tyrosine phosphatase [Hexamita inflata]
MSIDLSSPGLSFSDPEVLRPTSDIMNMRQDPLLSTVEDYRQYYLTEMNSVMEMRVKYMNDSEAKQYSEKHKTHNRYANITPILRTQPSLEYFNGNIIHLGRFDFLITQAPTKFNSFYKNVYSFKPDIIVQLTKFLEGNIPKADRYIPLIDGESASFYQESIDAQYTSLAYQTALTTQKNSIFLTKDMIEAEKAKSAPESFFWHAKQLSFPEENLIVRASTFKEISPDFYKAKLTIDYQSQNVECPPIYFDIKQKKCEPEYYYYGLWNDFQKPGSEEDVFNLCLSQQEHLKSENHKVLLHCSAGIGRSATFAVCLYIFECFSKKDLVSNKDGWNMLPLTIFEAVEALRTQRNPMCVQTVDQFMFLFSFAEYCKRKLM